MKASANSGSMPDDASAMIEIVPVGATVVRVALRYGASGSYREPFHAGKTPRSRASSSEASFAFSWMKRISSSPSASASSESYGTPSWKSMSCQPITPSPILRVSFVAWSISSMG